MMSPPLIEPAPEKYSARNEADILDLVLRHPFAWVVSAEEGFSVSALPLRPELKDGQLIAFQGHFSRRNTQIDRLRRTPRAAVLFTGANTYISPSWMADRTQAPTWNYAAAAFECDLSLIEDAPGIQTHLRDLADANEDGRPGAWSVDEMGPRYEKVSRGVVAFRAEIIARRIVFKVGQDERDDVFADILSGLDRSGKTDMAALMRDFATGR